MKITSSSARQQPGFSGLCTVSLRNCFLALFIPCVIALGCHREVGPPAPLPAENIPGEFQKAFAKAAPEAKDLSSRVVAALTSKEYAGAYAAVQELCASPQASKAQKQLAARALLTITGLLQTAQSQGDQSAAEALELHKMFK